VQISAELAGETVAWLDRQGLATQPLLDELRIDRRELAYGRQIPAAHFAAILDFGAARTGDDYFGLHRGGEFRLESGGVLAYLAAAAETVGEALSHYQRYVSVVCDGFATELQHDGDNVWLVLHVADKAWGSCRHLPEFILARTVGGLRMVTGLHLRPLSVEFSHSRPEPVAECARLFGCEVGFARRVDAIELPRDALALRIPTADSRLGTMLRSYADGLLEKVRPQGGDSLAERAAAVIAQRLSSGEVSLSDIATRLHMSERTLRRRLKESGVTFGELVEHVRRDLADEWLRHTDFNVKHISYLLGYSEPAAFSRAYKRWTGRSPGQAAAA